MATHRLKSRRSAAHRRQHRQAAGAAAQAAVSARGNEAPKALTYIGCAASAPMTLNSLMCPAFNAFCAHALVSVHTLSWVALSGNWKIR